MAEYIDRKVLLEGVKGLSVFLGGDNVFNKTSKDCVLEMIDEQPTVDVVKVVRCEDCKFHREAHYEDEGEQPYIKQVCSLYKRTMRLDDYCSYGERKE